MACGLSLSAKGYPFAFKKLEPKMTTFACDKESEMPKTYEKIVATVTKGKCGVYKKGDQIVFEGSTMKGNVCTFALTSLLPVVIAMRYGAEFPWIDDKNVYTDLACPDGANPVIFEIKRS